MDAHLTIGDLNVIALCIKNDLGLDHPLWGEYATNLVAKLEEMKYEEIKRINTQHLTA